MTYYKFEANNMIIDLVEGGLRYVKYLPSAKRTIAVQKDVANGVMGSDGETIYHLFGKTNNFPEKKKTIKIKEIGEEEYHSLAIQFSIQRQENETLREEVSLLKEQISEQTELLRQLLAKL